jgi:hypothetical protein
MSDLESGLSSPTDHLNINDSAEGHNEDLEYDEEDMRGETLWNDLTNLHKEVIKSVNGKKKKGIIQKIKLFYENYGKTFPIEENTTQVLNIEDRKEKGKSILEKIKKSIKPITDQRNRIIPEFEKVNHLNDMKNVNIRSDIYHIIIKL